MLCLDFHRRILLSVVLTLAAILSVTSVRAQEQENASAPLVTRIYPVADLVFSPPDYPFQGVEISGNRARGVSGFGGGGGGGMGGTVGGMGGAGTGGFGGGQFHVSDLQGAGSSNINLDELIEAITTSFVPMSWDEQGGPASIVSFRNQLIVSQTAAIHSEIEKLLADLRKQAAQGTITIRAAWFSLSGAQLAALTAGMPATSPPLVDRAKLDALLKAATEVPRPATAPAVDAGEITCFNGQTVHIVSGRFRGAVTSVVPVVGQIETAAPAETAIASTKTAPSNVTKDQGIDQTVLAQVVETPSPAPVRSSPLAQSGMPYLDVGYQPVVSTQHSGIMLEVTPIAMPEQQAVVLDLRSIVSQWQTPAHGTTPFAGVTDLDQTEVISQQLATTIKLPLGKPVIAGGLTLEPQAPMGTSAMLYLVVEAVTNGTVNVK